MNNKVLGIVLPVVALFLILALSYTMGGVDLGAVAAPQRFGAALLMAIGMGLVVYLKREHPIWNVSMREVINGFAGAMLCAVFVWLFAGTLFPAPAVGDLALRPAAIFPVLFGFLFGPVPGFIAGAFGSLFGNLLAGAPVAPEWEMGLGLLGFISGLHMVFPKNSRTLDIAGGVIAAIGLIVTLVYILNPALENPNAAGPISAWLGYSLLAGGVLVLALRYAFPDETWTEVVVWGALGATAGLGLAALFDIWIEAGQLTAAEASVGRLLPTAGPAIIAILILIPFLMASYRELQSESA